MNRELDRRRLRMADAAKAWKIDAPNAPSARGSLQLVARWNREVRRRVEAALTLGLADAVEDPPSIFEQEELARKLRSIIRGIRLPPPPPAAWERVGEPASRQAIRGARKAVTSIVPRAKLAAKLGVDEKTLLGIDIAPTLAEQQALTNWAKDGTDRIRSVSQALVEGLDEHIMDAARRGTLTRDLRKIVQDRLGVSESRAQFIARDQISKLNGKITEATQKSAGVTSYKWRTSGDQRVRADHRELEGTIQAWADPPVVDEKTGRREHPGGDYQCRCVAIPMLDDDGPVMARTPEPAPPDPIPEPEPVATAPEPESAVGRWQREDPTIVETEGGTEFTRYDHESAVPVPEGHYSLFRATTEPDVWQGGHLTKQEDWALEYGDNPGFGGASVYRYDIPDDPDKIAHAREPKHLAQRYLEALTDDERETLTEYADLDPDRDPGPVKARELSEMWASRGFDFTFQVLENSPIPSGALRNGVPDLEDALRRAGKEWIGFLDDFPEGSITRKYIGENVIEPAALVAERVRGSAG